MDFNIPVYVENIIDKLEEKNYEAYIVGGSVRDLLIGREPSDYDNNRIGIAIQLYRTFRIRSRGFYHLKALVKFDKIYSRIEKGGKIN